MLFATDKFTLSSGDTAKLTIQYENTTLTNTGKKQAIVEASKDGYTWAQVASIAPDSSLPLKIEALYIRLTTDTTISVVNTNPIPRDAKKSDIAVNINTEALVIKDDLQAYVSKNELNDLVQHPDLSDYVTTRQLQDAIPDVPEIPDVSGLATKESVATKADQTALDELKLTVATKADSTTVAGLQTQLTNTIIPTISHLNDTKADKTELSTLSDTVALSSAQAQALSTQVNGFQSQLDNRLTLEQAEAANHVLLNAIATKASTEQLTAVQDEVEQKATKAEVADLANKAISLEQDKANRSDVDTLSATVKLLQAMISGDIDGDLLEQTKEEIITSLNQTLPDAIKGMIPESLGQEELTALEQKLTQLIQTKTDTGHQHSMDDVTGLTEALNSKSPTNHIHTWGSITGKPTTFNPTTHGHGISDITGLQAQLDSKLAKQEAETTYAKKTELPQPVDLSGYATKQSVDSLSQAVNALSGTGDVDSSNLATKAELDGKANAVHTHTMAQVTGLVDSVNSKAPRLHTHTVANVVGLQAALDGKAPSSHSHSWNSITDKPTTFAPSTHTHGITDVSGLQDALDAKAPATHSHTVNWADISGKPTTFTPSSHTHAWSQITGVPSSSTRTAGIVQLNDTLASTATDQALTANQGKALQDNKLDKTANAVSASKLATARTINGVVFDGTANITITDDTKAPTVHRHNWSEIDSVPAVISNPVQITSGDLNSYTTEGFYFCDSNVRARAIANTASNRAFALQVVKTAGVVQIYYEYQSAAIYSRVSYPSTDQWSAWKKLATTDDNAVSATKLQTPRTINGVAFDGTQNITIYDNTKLASNGNAVSASRLATARTISLTGMVTGSVSFDGSANVSIATTMQQGLGVEQTWQDVRSSRISGVTYTNSTGKPIFVRAFVIGGNKSLIGYVNDMVVDRHRDTYNSGEPQISIGFIVPNGATYRIEYSHIDTAILELR